MEFKCPTCGGQVWDNRPKKKDGSFSPKAPDFKCRDKDCGGVIWRASEYEFNDGTEPSEPSQSVPSSSKEFKRSIDTPNTFNTCNAMNNAVALIAAGKAELEDLEDLYDRIVKKLES